MTLDHRKKPRLLTVIVGTLFILTILYTLYIWYMNDQISQEEPTISQTQTQPKTEIKAEMRPEIQTEAQPSPNALITEAVLKSPIPEHESLAKDEITKLNDIQQQLVVQANTLKTQIKDADQLIRLKEEQIQILEKQLATYN